MTDIAYYTQRRSGREIGMARARARRRELNMIEFRDVLAAEPQAFREWLNGPKAPRFLVDALTQWGRLTDGQMACAKRIFAEDAARVTQRAEQDAQRRATAPAWTAGRQVITGTIEFAKFKDTQYGRSLKAIILLDDNRKLWTSLPSEMGRSTDGEDEATLLAGLKGQRVTLNVTVKPADDDATMGWGSRPVVVS